MYRFKIFIAIITLCYSSTNFAATQGVIKIITSFSILNSLVLTLGGEYVKSSSLVKNGEDIHLYKPSIQDIKALAAADLFIINGLGFEGWLVRTRQHIDAKKIIIASTGITPLPLKGTTPDPHAWQSLKHIKDYATNITAALIKQKPNLKNYFLEKNRQFIKEVDQLEVQAKQWLQIATVKQIIVLTSHDAFAYLGKDFNIKFLAPLGISTEDRASAYDMATIIKQIRAHPISAVFLENIANPKLLTKISNETGLSIYGRLYADSLPRLKNGKPTHYLAMIRHNLFTIAKAFKKN